MTPRYFTAALLVLGTLAAPVSPSFAAPAAASPASSYAGQETRAIKALSQQEVDAYLAGKGMGLAKAAELNGYPGPSHVLELAEPLQLTEAQRAHTRALFAAMEDKAQALGRALVERERELDQLFASRSADRERLARVLGDVGALQAQVRGAHLEAHIEQARILSAQQIARYAELRGYASAAPAQPAQQGGRGHRH